MRSISRLLSASVLLTTLAVSPGLIPDVALAEGASSSGAPASASAQPADAATLEALRQQTLQLQKQLEAMQKQLDARSGRAASPLPGTPAGPQGKEVKVEVKKELIQENGVTREITTTQEGGKVITVEMVKKGGDEGQPSPPGIPALPAVPAAPAAPDAGTLPTLPPLPELPPELRERLSSQLREVNETLSEAQEDALREAKEAKSEALREALEARRDSIEAALETQRELLNQARELDAELKRSGSEGGEAAMRATEARVRQLEAELRDIERSIRDAERTFEREERRIVRIERRSKSDAEDRVVFGGDNVVIQKGEKVKDLVVLKGNAEIYGEVEGDAVILAGDLTIHEGGVVRGDAVALAGRVDVQGGGQLGGEQVRVDLSALEHVQQHHEEVEEQSGNLDRVVEAVVLWLLLMAAGLLSMTFIPQRMVKIATNLEQRPLAAGAAGAIALGALIPASLVLAVTVVGILAIPFVWLGAALAGVVGLVATAQVLARRLPLKKAPKTAVGVMAWGFFLLAAASIPPVLGTIILAGAALFGLGSVVMTRAGNPSWQG